jgi:hypothetical protein
MKMIITVALLLAVTISYSVPARAANSCFCVGQNRTAGTCGHGGVAGNFGDVRKNLPENLMRYLLLSQALRDTLSASGKAYDPTSGWACWKE